MPVVIGHLDGPVEQLDAAEYTLRTASGRPCVCCPLCERRFEIVTPIASDGTATVVCPWWCSFRDEIKLDDWAGP